jgi:hypothetical protein
VNLADSNGCQWDWVAVWLGGLVVILLLSRFVPPIVTGALLIILTLVCVIGILHDYAPGVNHDRDLEQHRSNDYDTYDRAINDPDTRYPGETGLNMVLMDIYGSQLMDAMYMSTIGADAE